MTEQLPVHVYLLKKLDYQTYRFLDFTPMRTLVHHQLILMKKILFQRSNLEW